MEVISEGLGIFIQALPLTPMPDGALHYPVYIYQMVHPLWAESTYRLTGDTKTPKSKKHKLPSQWSFHQAMWY